MLDIVVMVETGDFDKRLELDELIEVEEERCLSMGLSSPPDHGLI